TAPAPSAAIANASVTLTSTTATFTALYNLPYTLQNVPIAGFAPRGRGPTAVTIG
ncbi:MAG: hypothetical protein QOI83_843, partial [Streptomycetaceae bacterium]|nr:hypothetical protein [Streptomycetaceae bacterium]